MMLDSSWLRRNLPLAVAVVAVVVATHAVIVDRIIITTIHTIRIDTTLLFVPTNRILFFCR